MPEWTSAGRLGSGNRTFYLRLPPPASSLTIRAPRPLYVPRLLERRGLAAYEPDTLSCFLAALETVEGRTVFDVGANVGVFALVAAALSDREVVAFEPTPELARVARAIAVDNGLNYTVEELALGAAAATAHLHLSDTTDSSNSLRKGFRPSSGSITVPVETLDGYAARTGRVPALLKIDTESTEPDVLRGAGSLLAEHRPWIVCEVLAGRTEADLEMLLEPLGYRWFQIGPEVPLPRRDHIVGDPDYRNLNWLFCPTMPDARFWSSMASWQQALAACRPSPSRERAPMRLPDLVAGLRRSAGRLGRPPTAPDPRAGAASSPPATSSPPAAPSPGPAAKDPHVIGPGAHAARVRKVQEMVNHATTHKLTVDGVFGPRTIAGVKFLQRRLELPPTGAADALTLVLGQARIEAQLRRAHEPRRFDLVLPALVEDGAAATRTVRVTAPSFMYVPSLLQRGGLAAYEPDTVACFLAALAEHPGRATAFDVGANVGVFAWAAAAAGGWDVVAFEPTPELAEVARAVATANDLEIDVEEIALGAETGTATFYLSDVTDSSNSLAKGFRQSTNTLTVPVERLDDYCDRTQRFPSVLKIDTETTEPDVLRGAQRLLRERRPWIVCEVLGGYREDDLTEALAPHGYSWYQISDAAVFEPRDEIKGDPEHRDKNWLFAPAPPAASFWDSLRLWRERLQVCGPPGGGPA